jgi:predicted lipid-binding transport protein (Tim44 family)
MNKIIFALIALFSMSIMVAGDADARRMGGGSSLGKQRTITPPQSAPRAPQQAPSAAPTNPAQPAPSGASRWLGPLAGLALGAGLASLFFNNGFGGALSGILFFLLAAAAVMFVIRMLRSRSAAPPQASPLQYAGAGRGPAPSDFSSHFGGGAPAVASGATRYPPGFNVEEFVRHAKLNFTRLQAANDKRDLETMRDFMTAEMYREIAADLAAHGEPNQQTDVVTLEAEVLEVVTEGSSYVASVRFSGMIRERSDGTAEPFTEIWHLEKPLNGTTGWLISGIQQA